MTELESAFTATVEPSTPYVAYSCVRNLEDLAALDSEEMMRSYWAGIDNELFNGRESSRAFVHGYKTGQVDVGYQTPDAPQMALMDEMRALKANGPH